MVSREPSLWMIHFVVLRNMELISGPDECPIVLEIDLHYAQTRGMTWRMMKCDTLAKDQRIAIKGLPFQSY